MSSSTGRHFRVTTFGESHGGNMGVVVDGVPAGLRLTPEDISFELKYRRTGNYLVSGRREEDVPRIISGLFQGRTNGAPVTVLFDNRDAISSLYEDVRHMPRPGHADLSYIKKYGRENWDFRGGGRSSARETISRVAAGAIAKKLLMAVPTYVTGYLKSIGPVSANPVTAEESFSSKSHPTRAPDEESDRRFTDIIMSTMKSGDSYGGVAEVFAINPPESLGEPVFDKLKADLGKALLSLPAVTGFEYGLGFRAAGMKGSEAADEIVMKDGGRIGLGGNLSGGMLGGISTGEDIVVRCAFKPTSSIRIPAKTVDLDTGKPAEISVKGRHDPVVAVRGVSVAEAMVALVIADHAMLSGFIPHSRLPEELSDSIEGRWAEYMKRCQ